MTNISFNDAARVGWEFVFNSQILDATDFSTLSLVCKLFKQIIYGQAFETIWKGEVEKTFPEIALSLKYHLNVPWRSKFRESTIHKRFCDKLIVQHGQSPELSFAFAKMILDQAFNSQTFRNNNLINCSQAYFYLQINQLESLKASQFPKREVLYYLGRCHELGIGTKPNLSTAFLCYLKGAMLQDAACQYFLGQCYLYSVGTTFKRAQAFFYTQLSAYQGHAIAASQLGYLIQNGFVEGCTPDTAFKWHLKAAEKGIVYSQRMIGLYFQTAYGTAVADPENAFKYMMLAAEKGDVEAQMHISDYFCKGFGTKLDETLGFYFMQLAASQGNPSAIYIEGLYHEMGIGTPSNPQKAFKSMESAASLLYPDAQYTLGRYYEEGFWIKPNKEEALKNYLLAAIQGHVKANEHLMAHANFNSSPNKKQKIN